MRNEDLAIDRRSDVYLDFVVSLKILAGRTLNQNVQNLYKERINGFIAQTGHAPTTLEEVKSLVEDEFIQRTSRFLSRYAQEMMWHGIENAYKDRAPELIAELNRPEVQPLGTLTLNPALPIPAYYAHEFHLQPGGYYSDDFCAIAYHLEQPVYGLRNGNKARNMVTLAKACPPPPTKEPTQVRILVIGCGFGTPVWSLCDLYPQAEIHGVDLAAPLLKLAHKKAETKGKKVHFSQQNAECTNFEANSFDLVLANILFHELDKPAIANVTAEAYRLLKPGGHFVNSDVPPYRTLTPFQQFVTDWQEDHNCEPFWRSTRLETDLPALFNSVGFSYVYEQNLNAPGPAPNFPWLTVGRK
jgi:SAM-dependent methyltransferase